MELTHILDILFSLATLTLLEIILGVDNLVFISIASSRLPKSKQKAARKVGLFLAWFTRLLLLASAVWLATLTKPLITIFSHDFSGRDLLLLVGGLFLLVKGTREIHAELENQEAKTAGISIQFASFSAVVIQIAILDIIFSLDSVLTAIGMTQTYWIMATAITIAIIAMIFASEPLSQFVNKHPTIKMLALSFLLLIGMVLVADGFKFHVPKPYVYFAVAFSVFVEILNTLVTKRNKARKKHERTSHK